MTDNVQQRGGFNGYGPLDALPAAYLPFSQFPKTGLRGYHGWFSPAWIVRVTPGTQVEQGIRAAMADVDPQLAISAVRPVDAVRSAALGRQGVVMAVAGLVVGCGVAVGVSGLLQNLLWGVKANDPLTFVAVVATLLFVAVAASVVPALRVRRLDLVSLLRSE